VAHQTWHRGWLTHGDWSTVGCSGWTNSADIKRLDRQQTETAIDVYNTKLRSLLVIAPAENTPAYQAWKEEFDQTREQIKRAEDRKIELSK
jgi:hypothetical protein